MPFLLLKISGRNFVVMQNDKKEYSNFIVSEFTVNCLENSVFNLSKSEAFIINGGIITSIECKIKVLKILKNHVKSFVKLRRKRHKKLVGYIQKVAYLSVIL